MNIIPNYSKFSFVVSGSTKEFKDELMALGGKYNPNLTTGPGYVFSNKKEEEVRNFINKHNESFGHDILLPQNNKKDVLSLNNKLLTNKTIKSPLPSMNSSINYPNRFVGSDGLSYQIIIETCPLPFLNQQVTVKYIDSDNGFESTVSNINDGSPINDITLTYEEGENYILRQTRAMIINGKWQIHLLESSHELIFH